MDVNIIPFFSPISPVGAKEEVQQELAKSGARIIEPDDFGTSSGRNYFFIGTGGTENLVADFLEKTKLPSPITILSYDLRNSHPSAMEIRSYLENQKIESRIIHAPLDQLVHMIDEWSEFAQYLSVLDGSTMGLVGEPSSWLIASSVEPVAVKNRWGMSLKDLSLDPLIEAAKSTDKHEHIESFKTKATGCAPSDDELHKAGSVAESLKRTMKKENLDAVTVQCFKLLMDTKVSGCYALNFLNNDKELVAGCEGDVPATFTMFLGKLLTGGPGFMSNVTKIDSENNSAVFAHCTLPTSIAESYQVTTHFETGLSIGIRGTFEKQDVTVFKVFGDDLGNYWVSDGKIVDNLVNSTGCRTQIRVELEEDVSYFLERAYANHHIVFPGKHAERIRRFFDFL
jgi:L-fucose isomerase-like protein